MTRGPLVPAQSGASRLVTVAPPTASLGSMDETLQSLLFFAGFFVVQLWLLPRLGVPT